MRVLIVGGGRIGTYLAEDLSTRGHSVTVVEKRPERAAELASEFSGKNVRVVAGDGNDPAVLREAGARDVDALVAATGEDEDNLVAGLLGKREFGVRRVVGRVNNPRNSWLYSDSMGFDVSVHPAEIIVSLLEEELEE